MNDSYFTQASNYAKKAADEYKSTFDSTLNDLLTMSNLQKEQAKNSYNNLLNQINANRASLQQNYETNARQAYVNKLLADQQTTDTLSRMNLNQSGFRLTQDTLTNNRYDASLNQLALAQDQGLRDLDTQGLNALNDYNNNLLKLDLDYNSKLAALKEQINENVTNYYNKEYDKFYNDLKYQDQLKQQEAENERANKKYEDQLKQQAFENKIKQEQLEISRLNAKKGSSGGGGDSLLWTNPVSTIDSARDTELQNNQQQPGANQMLKYNIPGTNKGHLSNDTQYKLASFLLRKGTRENGKYSASNTSVSYADLVEFVSQLQDSGASDAEIQYIAKLFGVPGAVTRAQAGGGNGSFGGGGSGGAGFR